MRRCTYFPTAETKVEPNWYVVDATDQVLGRLAAALAYRLRGKHKPEFTPHADVGDCFIVINADKLRVTGNKEQDKLYYRHSGYPGGLKSMSFAQKQAKKPGEVLQKAVKGMLPRNPLGRAVARKLHIYAGTVHPHTAQKPTEINLLSEEE